ncbi:hypothetical protein SNEBB_006296 [Seison nebaliae]|nr:hypothetical protein SNEBB_006296 [Seison nebaliae]
MSGESGNFNRLMPKRDINGMNQLNYLRKEVVPQQIMIMQRRHNLFLSDNGLNQNDDLNNAMQRQSPMSLNHQSTTVRHQSFNIQQPTSYSSHVNGRMYDHGFMGNGQDAIDVYELLPSSAAATYRTNPTSTVQQSTNRSTSNQQHVNLVSSHITTTSNQLNSTYFQSSMNESIEEILSTNSLNSSITSISAPSTTTTTVTTNVLSTILPRNPTTNETEREAILRRQRVENYMLSRTDQSVHHQDDELMELVTHDEPVNVDGNNVLNNLVAADGVDQSQDASERISEDDDIYVEDTYAEDDLSSSPSMELLPLTPNERQEPIPPPTVDDAYEADNVELEESDSDEDDDRDHTIFDEIREDRHFHRMLRNGDHRINRTGSQTRRTWFDESMPERTTAEEVNEDIYRIAPRQLRRSERIRRRAQEVNGMNNDQQSNSDQMEDEDDDDYHSVDEHPTTPVSEVPTSSNTIMISSSETRPINNEDNNNNNSVRISDYNTAMLDVPLPNNTTYADLEDTVLHRQGLRRRRRNNREEEFPFTSTTTPSSIFSTIIDISSSHRPRRTGSYLTPVDSRGVELINNHTTVTTTTTPTTTSSGTFDPSDLLLFDSEHYNAIRTIPNEFFRTMNFNTFRAFGGSTTSQTTTSNRTQRTYRYLMGEPSLSPERNLTLSASASYTGTPVPTRTSNFPSALLNSVFSSGNRSIRTTTTNEGSGVPPSSTTDVQIPTSDVEFKNSYNYLLTQTQRCGNKSSNGNSTSSTTPSSLRTFYTFANDQPNNGSNRSERSNRTPSLLQRRQRTMNSTLTNNTSSQERLNNSRTSTMLRHPSLINDIVDHEDHRTSTMITVTSSSVIPSTITSASSPSPVSNGTRTLYNNLVSNELSNSSNDLIENQGINEESTSVQNTTRQLQHTFNTSGDCDDALSSTFAVVYGHNRTLKSFEAQRQLFQQTSTGSAIAAAPPINNNNNNHNSLQPRSGGGIVHSSYNCHDRNLFESVYHQQQQQQKIDDQENLLFSPIHDSPITARSPLPQSILKYRKNNETLINSNDSMLKTKARRRLFCPKKDDEDMDDPISQIFSSENDENRNELMTTAPRDSAVYYLSPLTERSQVLLQSPRKPTNKIATTPFKVLDAPDLQDDYYLNLVDWSPQNRLSVGLGSCVYLWNACTSQVTKLCDISAAAGDRERVTSVAWSERCERVAVGTVKGSIQIWDAIAQKKIDCLHGHAGRVGSLAWNDDMIASGSRDRNILIRDLRAPPYRSEIKLSYHKQEVCGLKWSPDKQLLASGGNDNKILVWSPMATNGDQPLQVHDQHIAAVKAIAWSPHQHGLLASGGGTADRCIRFWNTLTDQSLQCIDTGSQVCNLAWSKHTNELVSTHGYSEYAVNVWSYPTMNRLAKLTGHSARVLYLSISPDGESIVTGAGDETLRFWNVFSKSRASKEKRSMLNICGIIR